MARIIDITDFSAPELDIYARLTENQLVNRADPDNALFVAESPLVIGRALDAGCTPVSFLMERKHITGKGAEVLARCPADIPVYAAELPVLTQLTGFHLTRGMLCAMRRPRLPSVEEVCAGARRIAVLENVMNPTNIGAIFRSAAALNVDAVLLTAAGSDPLYRRAARVSMGNVFLVPWTYLPEGESWPDRLGVLALDPDTGGFFDYHTPRVHDHFHGTGDIFSAACAGAMVRGKSLPEALRLAADFTLACIQATCRDPNAPWYGVEFEKALHLLPGLLEQ